jgi:methyltransferase (TIGR00027 family)
MSWPQIMKLGEARATYPMLTQTLRTMHFDATVQQAMDNGARQVVILGAGLDTRAYRLKGIEAAKVFEVDYPPTQEYKRGRVMAAIGNIPKNLTYVGIDFTKQTLDDVLPAAGYRADAQTIFLLEGVTYYIGEPSLASTLRFVSKNTAAGSRILFDYLDRRLLDGAGLEDYQRLAKSVAAFGEPFILGLVPPKMTQFLSQSDLTFQSDYSTGELCVKYTPSMSPSMMIDSYRWGFHYCLANVKA